MVDVIVADTDSGNDDNPVAETIAVEAAVTSAVAANDAQHATEDAEQAAIQATVAAEVSETVAEQAADSAAASAESAARAEVTLAGVAQLVESLPERIREALASGSETETGETEDNPYQETEVIEEAPPQRQGWLAKHFSRNYDARR
jgi:hypothetical protein